MAESGNSLFVKVIKPLNRQSSIISNLFEMDLHINLFR